MNRLRRVRSALTDLLGVGLWFATLTHPVFADNIQSLDIRIDGPGWTRPHVIEQVFSQKPGRDYDPKSLWLDIERIRNYEIFQAVTATVTQSTSGYHIDIDAIDRWSVFPVVQPTFGGGIFHLLLGVRDANFLGLAHDVTLFGGAYVSDISTGFIGGGQWLDRQFFGRHLLAVTLQRNYGVESFYASPTSISSQIEREVISGLIQFQYRHYDYWQPGLFLLISDYRFKRLGGNPLFTVPPRTTAIRPGLTFKAGKVDYDAFLYDGSDAVLSVYREQRTRGLPSFWGGSIQARGFLLPHPKINLAGRVKLATRNAKHPTDQLSLGGFSDVRGYPSGFLRGTYTGLLNAEARFTLFERLFNTFFVQAVGFYDAGFAGSGTFMSEFDARGHAIGAGFRGAIHQIVGVFGRLDVAKSLSHAGLNVDIGIGVKQFF